MKQIWFKVFYCVAISMCLAHLMAEDIKESTGSDSQQEVPTTYREWSDQNETSLEQLLQGDVILDAAVNEASENDITTEKYLNNLDKEIGKTGSALIDIYNYNKRKRSATTQELCKDRELELSFLRLGVYKENLLKNKIKPSREEYIDFLKSIGFPDNRIDAEVHAMGYDPTCADKLCASVGRLWDTWYGKPLLISGGVAFLYCAVSDIYNYCKKHCAKRKQNQKTTVATKEITVFEIR